MHHLKESCAHPFASFRADVVAAFIEFFGTMMFLLIGLGGVQAAATSNSAALAAAVTQNGGAQSINTVASIQQLLYAAVSMGLALLATVWMFYRVTGGVFNPAVSFTLFLVGAIGPVRFVLYFVAQMAGAIAASAILAGLLPGPLAVTPSLGANTTKAQGLFIEMFITAALCLAVLMLAVEKHKATPLAPVAIGLTLFGCHMFALVYTGAGMNSARAFGPAVITGFNDDHWIYWVGPFLGSLLATAVYFLLHFIDYWQLNPGQDTDAPESSPIIFSSHRRSNESNRPVQVRSRGEDTLSPAAHIASSIHTGGEKIQETV
jgi:aquaporin related protein